MRSGWRSIIIKKKCMNPYLSMLLGVLCAALGGELFVRGTVGIARWARIAPGIIGATVAAFATSSPELSVGINSALAGTPQISLGDSLGSNVVNVALILGAALVVSGIQSSRDSLKRDFPVALLAPILTGILLLDGVLSRIDGCILLFIFAAWLIATVAVAMRQRSEAPAILSGTNHWLTIGVCAAGLALLIAAGTLIVDGAIGIALEYGVGEFAIGATVVAIGTSVPELATTLIAKIKGHDEIGLGTVLGSNVFNGLFIVGIVAVIHPITVGWHSVIVALISGVAALALSFPPRSGFINRWRGILLLSVYGIYLAAILLQGGT
jgi:cation:H+ antiporter